MCLTSLSYHIDLEFMQEAYRRTRKNGAPGVDGQSFKDFEESLDENLTKLIDEAKSGLYRAPPVRRVQIPKGDGKQTRPIGIPTLRDKVLQRAVTMLLEQVYEQDFLDLSYGFRPRRSAHNALDSLWHGTMMLGGGWVLDADIKGFFDTLDHRIIQELLRKRVRDGVLTRLVGKWLNAGVMEDGAVSYPKRGTPQGGVISPLLANIYLHYAVDIWWQKEVYPSLRGDGVLVRYADDFVVVFQYREDALRVLEALRQRLSAFGLELHPDKTRLVQFRRPPRRKDHEPLKGRPGSFDFLGFTHYWGQSRKGKAVLKRKTASSRINRTLKRLNVWLSRHRHKPVRWQHERLILSLRGHYAYFGIIGNYHSLNRLLHEVERLWRKWLSRRSRKGKKTWDVFSHFLQIHPLPRPRIYHASRPVANL
jgi:RNA-directed DNA polymerase